MIDFKITENTKAVSKQLRNVRRVGVNKAWKKTLDDMALLIARALKRDWERAMQVKQKNFMGTKGQGVLRISKAYIDFDTGVIKRFPNIHNIFADELLLDQIQGGTRTPTGGKRKLIVPIGNKVRRTVKGKTVKPKKTYIKGQKDTPGTLWEYKKTAPDGLIGVVTPKADIKRRYPLTPSVRRAMRKFNLIANRNFRIELRRAFEKGYR